MCIPLTQCRTKIREMLIDMVGHRATVEAMIADAEVSPVPLSLAPIPVKLEIIEDDDADGMSNGGDIPLPFAPIPLRRSARLAALSRQ